MFSSFKQKLILGVYILILISIPIGAYLTTQNQNPTASAKKEPSKLDHLKPLTATPSANANGALKLGDIDEQGKELPNETKTTLPSTFGPTLNLKLILEGRPHGKMASKIFVGIVDGTISSQTPKYILSFYIDLPDSGLFEGLSLAGLNAGTTYSAVLKGPAQIATSSAFAMSPTITNLNNGKSLTLLSGDLNEDNTISSADYSLAREAFGSNSSSANWNPNIDFNLDGIINSADLAIILKNMTKTGSAGVWGSTPATKSASLEPESPSIGSPSGYWLWVPGF